MQLLSILRMASGASLWRGLDYVEQGRVKNLRPGGEGVFDAEVEGTANLPYTVHVDTVHVRQSHCDCPHAAGTKRICKHMVATVFAALPAHDYPRARLRATLPLELPACAKLADQTFRRTFRAAEHLRKVGNSSLRIAREVFERALLLFARGVFRLGIGKECISNDLYTSSKADASRLFAAMKKGRP